jgi:hypothetical protein
MSGSTHDDELAALQAALGRLAPAPDGVNIARLLFHAGQASVPRRNWAWPCATMASALLAAALGGVLLLRPAPAPVERVITVYVQSPGPPTPRPEPSVADQPSAPSSERDTPTETGRRQGDADYLQLRREVLAKGVDALPPPAPWPATAPPDDADSLLDMPRGSREPWFLRLKHSLQSGGAS